MSLTPETGAKIARQIAATSANAYRLAVHTYGSLLSDYTEDFPKAFSLGHLARVNPSMNPTPAPLTDRRRGFMFVSSRILTSIEVKWENLDNPTTCAYVWGYDLNHHARQLSQQYNHTFTSPDADFWRSVYLRQTLGDTTFNTLWARRDPNTDSVYTSLLYAVNDLRKTLPGWSTIHLKQTVFVSCAVSYEFAKQGGSLLTYGFGRSPVLRRVNLTEVFN